MKINHLRGLLALSLFCIVSVTLSAQPARATLVNSQSVLKSESFKYSNFELSDPAIYADEEFSISLTVENTEKNEITEEVVLMLKDESAAQIKRPQVGTSLTLAGGATETVTFTFTAQDLVKPGEAVPDTFVFYLGDTEIGVSYVKE
ncbi:hypothetical protein FUA23_13880 [Neolewinella aurantiaca]|uniref:Uncharacterized protein n=1 Tax=Neolewinella aurantiaca TaxID=2602767 RepID=A0A5C7FE62_9BACT|nr:hypothetical protein [Neolewinella aurantiaca]TXF88552.1 hypothetical protein FUA23_13880 [Neolewinella aurantiaca]